jgi:hypothetical protein
MTEFGRLVSEALGLFKAGRLDSCHDRLVQAFEYQWEEAMKTEPNFKNSVLLAFKLWFRAHEENRTAEELLNVP